MKNAPFDCTDLTKANRDNIEFALVDVTPDLAERWLGTQRLNRKLRPGRVGTYAADMSAQKWPQTGEGVKFDRTGHIIDGQHRLHAVIQSGATVSMLIVWNVPLEAQKVIDGQAPRSFANALELDSKPYATLVAGIARAAYMWESGSRTGVLGSQYKPSIPQLEQIIAEHPEIEELAAEASRLWKGCYLTPTITGACLWVLNNIDADDSIFFFEALHSGSGLKDRDPILVLRHALIDWNMKNDRMDRIKAMALVFKAWNAYRRGELISQLRWSRGGARPEKFPEPI